LLIPVVLNGALRCLHRETFD